MPITLRILLAVAAWLAALAASAAETLLLERRSQYNTVLVSENERGLRILRFERGGALQSVVKPGDPDHLELSYTRAMPVAFLHVPDPQRVLVVGLGGGSIPGFVHRRFPRTRVDVVEIDPVVVAVAKSHFGYVEDARMRCYVEDGRAFIERSPDRYDVIFLDGFGTDSVPRHLTTREFMQAVKRALRPGGIVVGNVWARSHNRLYDSMIRTYRTVYDQVSLLDVGGAANRLVIGTNGAPVPPLHELIERARHLTQKLALRTDITPIVERGYRAAGTEGDAGQVLVDDPPTSPSGAERPSLVPAPAY